MTEINKAARRALRMARQYYYSFFPDAELMSILTRSPGALVLETVNTCNANCIFCAYQYQERPKTTMSDATFEKAISDYVNMGGGDLALIVVVGDPLLDPKFVRRVRWARAHPCIRNIETITNCISLHKFGAKNLLTSGLTAITVSTTGFDAEMYQRIYRSKLYRRMKQNLLDLLRTNHELGRPVKILIGLRIDRPVEEVLNNPEFKEVIELTDSIDANAYFDSWSGRIKPEDLTGNMKLRPNALMFMKKRTPCAQLWSGVGVLVDGTVTACACRDLNGDSDLVLGNINKSSLPDLYHSEYVKKLRGDWFDGRNIPNICRDCTHYNPYTSLMTIESKRKILPTLANRKIA